MYAAQFIRSRATWSLPQGEVAQCQTSWRLATGLTTDLTEAQHTVLDLKWLALWATIRPHYTGDHVLVKTQSQLINQDGSVAEGYETGRSSAGTGSTDPLPSEVAVVVSLSTGVSNRNGKGRFYLPNPDIATVTSLGRLDATVQATFADAAQTLLSADPTSGLQSIVPSFTGAISRSVTACSVGDVFDVQRRRRDDLVEVRTSRVVDSTP